MRLESCGWITKKKMADGWSILVISNGRREVYLMK